MKAFSQHGIVRLTSSLSSSIATEARFGSELSQYNSIAELTYQEIRHEDALNCTDVHVFRFDWIIFVESQSQIPSQHRFKNIHSLCSMQ